MLNISKKGISHKVTVDQYESFKWLSKNNVSRVLIKLILGVLLALFLSMFLPWTQNIRSKGFVTTLRPDDRPQTVQTMISGKIENWYVQEGQDVKAGDTIMLISEVKEEYLDPQILERTAGQINAKAESAIAYNEKARNMGQQLTALERSRIIKLEQNEIKIKQAQLKLQSDSMDLVASQLEQDIAEKQLIRIEELYNQGIKSLTDLETRKMALQEKQAKVISLENKVDAQKNELLNLKANVIAIDNEYFDKIAKSRADQMSAMSDMYNAEANVNKLQSDYNSYNVRQQNYYIKSPIDGTITKAIKYGIGEIISNGDPIVSIMPEKYVLAVEMYVRPRDLPLVKKGQIVRLQFDGWPSIVFSGWPYNAFGTFGGRVFAIDKFISDNGRYRILVEPDPNDRPWPEAIRVGGGANTITLLSNVRLGYEIWRQLNGFPPNYYQFKEREDLKGKAPLRKIK